MSVLLRLTDETRELDGSGIDEDSSSSLGRFSGIANVEGEMEADYRILV